MSLRQSVASMEYVYGESVSVDGQNPTADVVEFAFVAPGVTPDETDWLTGGWATADTGPWRPRMLVAGDQLLPIPPEAVALAAGTYIVWIRVHDNPETPARPIDQLVMF